MAALFSLIVVGALLRGLAAFIALARAGSSQADHDPQSSDLHGSNANFGNSLRGETMTLGMDCDDFL